MNIKNCPICKEPYKKRGKYCGRKCYAEARRIGIYKPYWLHKKRDTGTIKKMSDGNKGKKPWNTGKKLSDEHKEKIANSRRNIYKGEKHPLWKGKKKKDERGYVRVYLDVNKWIYEHRMMMEQHLRRQLLPEEVVHHINENTSDNRLENLMLFPNNTAHLAYHRHLKKTNTQNDQTKQKQ